MRFASSTSCAAVKADRPGRHFEEEAAARPYETSLRLDLLGDCVVSSSAWTTSIWSIIESLVEVRRSDRRRGRRSSSAKRDLVRREATRTPCRPSSSVLASSVSSTETRRTDDRRLGAAHRSAPPVKADKLAALCVRQTAAARRRHSARRGGRPPWAERPIFASARLDPAQLARKRRDSVPSGVPGRGRGEPQLLLACFTLPSQSRQRPRWKRTLWLFG
jgi:hypothetical protein